MKLYFIAGEQSGDFIGSKIISSLKAKALADSKEIEVMGVGGDLMIQEGMDSLFSIDKINLMGFIEIIPHIFSIKKLIDETVADIAYKKPDILITIDSPGFTKRVAKEVKKHLPQIKLIHVVAPSVWAYREGRAKTYAEIYDHLLTLLPFEPPYFEKYGLATTCIGHPILEQNFYVYSNGLKEEMKLPIANKIISVTPGSRKNEIRKHMPIIKKVLDRIAETKDITAIFIQSNESNIKLLSGFLTGARFSYRFSTERLKSFAVSDVALAKSGTNTLEIAASRTAQIVGYKLNPISYFIIKLMIKIKFACLINIMAGREVIPEFIQNEYNEDNLVIALSDLLSDNKKAEVQVNESIRILQKMGLYDATKPSEIAANKIFEIYDSLARDK